MNTTALVKSLASRGDLGTGLVSRRLCASSIGEVVVGLARRDRKSTVSTLKDFMVLVEGETL